MQLVQAGQRQEMRIPSDKQLPFIGALKGEPEVQRGWHQTDVAEKDIGEYVS